MQDINFSTIRRIHLVGIKGIAMAAFAMWAKEFGIAVTGSDIEEHFPSDALLLRHGISIYSGFDPSHISESQKPDVVVYTGAHKGLGNVEVQRAITLHIPVLAHGKALGLAMSSKRQISVAGSHGKTTTSAMIAMILMRAQLDPSFAVGCGEIRGLGDPGHAGHGDIFVAEADEYCTDPQHDPTPRFMWQHPEFLVATNIDFDHPDVYENLEKVQQAFISLQRQLVGKKITIFNADNPESVVLQGRSHVTFGTSKKSDYRIDEVAFGKGTSSFSLVKDGNRLGRVSLQVPGDHNVLNAAAAAAACLELGLSWNSIVEGLAGFGGAKRRFELLAYEHEVYYYDDYAHHPREIQATLQAARAWFPKNRIIAIFQPHTYSRTASLLSLFAESFSDSDIVCITDIYASARESDSHEITTNKLIDAMRMHHDAVVYTSGKEDIISFLSSQKKPGDIVLFLGAGDIYSWEQDIIRELNT